MNYFQIFSVLKHLLILIKFLLMKKKDSEVQPEEALMPEEAALPGNPSEPAEPEPDPVEEAYCLGAGIDRETLQEAKALIARIAQAASSGKFDPEVLHMALRLLNYDREIENARKSGNKDKEEAASLPHLTGTKGLGSTKGDSIFDIARKAH